MTIDTAVSQPTDSDFYDVEREEVRHAVTMWMEMKENPYAFMSQMAHYYASMDAQTRQYTIKWLDELKSSIRRMPSEKAQAEQYQRQKYQEHTTT